MKIRAYLRGSTDEQDATRARGYLESFVADRGMAISEFYIENASGTKMDRPELSRLLDEADKGDVILIEQVDRLTRLPREEWKKLKRLIESKGLFIVTTELETTHQILRLSENKDPMLVAVIEGLNNLMLDVLAATAHKDWADRRRRQDEGIERAKNEGKYKGRQRTSESLDKLKRGVEFVDIHGLKKADAARAAGVSVSSLYRFIKEQKERPA
ncbi:MAG: recombinase family protein [Marinobacterium sp.]|nr:recombinase family protein [Marinobacterium sp.]